MMLLLRAGDGMIPETCPLRRQATNPASIGVMPWLTATPSLPQTPTVTGRLWIASRHLRTALVGAPTLDFHRRRFPTEWPLRI